MVGVGSGPRVAVHPLPGGRPYFQLLVDKKGCVGQRAGGPHREEVPVPLPVHSLYLGTRNKIPAPWKRGNERSFNRPRICVVKCGKLPFDGFLAVIEG